MSTNENEKELCVLCHKNPGTIAYPIKPLSRGVEPNQLIRLCLPCRELTDANTDVGKAIRFLNEAINRLEKLRGGQEPPIESENFVSEFTEKIKVISANILILQGFVRDTKRLKTGMSMTEEDIWGPNGKPEKDSAEGSRKT